MKMLLRVLPFLFGIFLCTGVRAQTVYTHGRQLPGANQLTVKAELYPFYHGVASGDPLADRVIIWTRVTPDTLTSETVEGRWIVATDPQLQQVIREGDFETDATRDYTVKVDVDGLEAGTTYYYGFTALDRHSLTGRTKTSPTGAQSDHLRFGVVSCSNFQAGYFNAYARLAERNDLDAVVHLGDYIYEYANFVYGSAEVWDDRLVEPDREIVSLEDYRARYSTYRLDPDLRHLHQQHGIIAVWDDHESANNSYEDGASNHQEGDEGPWEARKDRSRQAYFEWMPIRETDDRSVYRSLSYGDLADLILLDTRLEGRDRQLLDVTDPALQAADRSMLGATQKAWLLDQLTTSTARYKLVASQVIFSEFNVGWSGALTGLPFEEVESGFLDIWDGYPAERRQLTTFLRDEALENVVVLSGDFHAGFAFEVADPPVTQTFREVDGLGRVPVYAPTDYDPETGVGAVAVEFATPSISAANFDETASPVIAQFLERQLVSDLIPNDTLNLGTPNPHMKYTNLTDHGYYLLDVREAGVQADYFYGPILEPSTEERFAAGFIKAAGSNRLVAATEPAAGKVRQDVPAPADPPGLPSAVGAPPAVTVLSLSPNPVRDALQLQYALRGGGRVSITLLDASGRTLRTLRELPQPAGIYSLTTSIGDLPVGSYYLRITTPQGISLQPLIRR